MQPPFCYVLLKQSPDRPGRKQRWILGNTFLRAYDSIHDIQNRRIGLVGPAETIPKEKLKEMYDPKEIPKEEIEAMKKSIPYELINEIYPNLVEPPE